MKRSFLFPATKILIIILIAQHIAYAESTAVSKSVPARATIAAYCLLNLEVVKFSDGTLAEEQNLNFGEVESGQLPWSTKPGEYIRLSVRNNVASWKLRVYTDNYTATPDTGTWGLQYGGLKGSSAGAKAAMGWACSTSASTSGPGTGDPSSGTINGWTYLKDFHDMDDPSTTTNDESFAMSSTVGYCNIAFGTPGSTRVVLPTITEGNLMLSSPATTFYFYVEGEFSNAPASEYEGSIKFDLINE